MRLTIDQDQTKELRLAIRERVDSLLKLKKKTEEEGLGTREIDQRIAMLKGQDSTVGLLQLLDDQTDAFNGGPPRDERQQTIDEALNEAERDAEKEARLAVLHEARRALSAALGLDQEPPGEEERAVIGEEDDNVLARRLLEEFDDIEWEDEDGNEKLAGVICHTDEEGETVWCMVRTDGGVPRFFYDVDVETFDIATATPTFIGEQLFRETRRAWGVLPEEPEPPVRVETETTDEPDEFQRWIDRTAPEPVLASPTAILCAGAHAAIMQHPDLPARLYLARAQGIDDETLASILTAELATTGAASVLVPGIGMVERISVEVKTSPVLTFTMKRGRKREALKGEQAVTAIRTMLELPERVAEEASAE